MNWLIAQNRFGLGVGPADPPAADPPAADPKAWLIGQFERFEARPAALAGQPSTAEVAHRKVESGRLVSPDGVRYTAEQRQLLTRSFRQYSENVLAQGVRARADAALASEAPFVERLVHFWANHFAISAITGRTSALAPGFEFEAIRPHVLGRFEDLLLSALRHPGLLTYLDQISSMGPNSQAAIKRNSYHRRNGNPDEFGANENFAREVLELHTLGVDGGYDQKDVVELAYALSGWSISHFTRHPQSVEAPSGAFIFNPTWHEPGRRTILGVTYAQPGEAKGIAALRDLARHPATARHVSWKLARHFVADDPPPALVARLADRFIASDGDLPEVYAELVRAPEAWRPQPAKIRTPWDWTLASLRALGLRSCDGLDMAGLMKRLGQPVWTPGSPAGWSDVGAAFSGTNMMLSKIEVARELAGRYAAGIDPEAMAEAVFGGRPSAPTRRSLAEGDGATRIALILLSSEFLRR